MQNALRIHIQPRIQIIQGIANPIEIFIEFIIEHILTVKEYYKPWNTVELVKRILSVSGPTRTSYALTWKLGFISCTALLAHSDLPFYISFREREMSKQTFMSLELNRNCRFRLERSTTSMSVTWTIWPWAVASPIIAQFFNISQPIAPAPTRK